MPGQGGQQCRYDQAMPRPLRERTTGEICLKISTTAKIGYAGEHILQKEGSAAVHSSLWALLRGPAVKPEFHLFIGARFCQRAAGAVAQALGIHLTDDQVYETERAKANIYNKPKPPQPEAAP